MSAYIKHVTHLCLPLISSSFCSTPKQEDFPLTYKTNTDKETLILSCCENFRRQFVHLYRDRKPLLLCPFNEAGVEVILITLNTRAA